MFEIKDGHKLFSGGRNALAEAARLAAECGEFKRDYEEECFYDEEMTCYNCRYRRWTENGFECMKRR